MNHEYTPEDIQMIKQAIFPYLQSIYKIEDLDGLSVETIANLYDIHCGLTANEFVNKFCNITKILPTCEGAYFKGSSEIYSGYFGWGMINLNWIEPNLVWIPEGYIEYHTQRLASGLIALKKVSVPTV